MIKTNKLIKNNWSNINWSNKNGSSSGHPAPFSSHLYRLALIGAHSQVRAPLGPADRRDAVLGAQVAEFGHAAGGGAPQIDAVAQTHLGRDLERQRLKNGNSKVLATYLEHIFEKIFSKKVHSKEMITANSKETLESLNVLSVLPTS